eukprot:m.174308 g.174308  ORF g.174308 m.174308 type:complete len:53 (-) comp13814_c0_seq1:53-211(-)
MLLSESASSSPHTTQGQRLAVTKVSQVNASDTCVRVLEVARDVEHCRRSKLT